MKRLSGLDATFLHLETPEMPMHVGALHVFELPKGLRGRYVDALRRHVAERLALMPALRRRVWRMPLDLSNPVWVDADPDLDEHIVEVALPAAAKRGDGMAALETLVGRLHPVLLDRSRPLWKFHVVEGLGPGDGGVRRVAVYTKLHHAAVDGQAAVALAQVLLDTAPDARAPALVPSARTKRYRLGVSEMLRGALANEGMQVARAVKALPGTIGTLADAAGKLAPDWWRRLVRGGAGDARDEEGDGAVRNLSLAPRSVLNGRIGTTRAFATLSLPLAELKALGRAHGATLNDVVLYLCSSALREHLLAHGALPRKSLVAAVPVSLREKGDTRSDNQASMSLVSLGTHLGSAPRRLAHVRAAGATMKQAVGAVRGVLPTDFPSIGVPWLMEAATALYGRVVERVPLLANVVISNVPGPPVPLYLAGARMTRNHPTSIAVHGMALNITVQSYDGQLDFGFMADGAALPDVRRLADGVRDAFDGLRALAPPGAKPPASAGNASASASASKGAGAGAGAKSARSPKRRAPAANARVDNRRDAASPADVAPRRPGARRTDPGRPR